MAATEQRIALLRGVNVGGPSRRVPMADLRAILAALGYGDPRTLLNSGNAVFTAPAAEPTADTAARIQAAIAERLGVRTRTFVLTAAELDAIVAEDPIPEANAAPPRYLITVLDDRAEAARRLAPLLARDWSPERLALGARAAYLWCPNGIAGGQLTEAVYRALGERGTARNRATLGKLQALTAAS